VDGISELDLPGMIRSFSCRTAASQGNIRTTTGRHALDPGFSTELPGSVPAAVPCILCLIAQRSVKLDCVGIPPRPVLASHAGGASYVVDRHHREFIHHHHIVHHRISKVTVARQLRLLYDFLAQDGSHESYEPLASTGQAAVGASI